MSGIRETAVGVFVLIGLLCVGYLTIKLGRMELFSQKALKCRPVSIPRPA